MEITSTPPAGGLTIDKGLPRRLFNRLVSWQLRSPLHGLIGASRFAMLLTYTGRKSGKSYALPLAYMREGDTVTTFALFTNTVWWKNLRREGGAGVPVTLRLRGRDVAGVAETVEDPEEVARGMLAMAESNPRLTRGGYYAVPREPDGSVNHEALLEAARMRVMIRIRLTDPEPAPGVGREFSPLMKRLMRTVVAAHVFVYRRTGGRVGARAIAPVLLLTTIGRKSGKKRTIPLSYMPDGERFVVVGAMGGAPKNPAWVHNLKADPWVTVQVGSREEKMLAHVARGEERERLWKEVNTLTEGGFEKMQTKTPREFPMVVLSPVGAMRGPSSVTAGDERGTS